MQQYHEVKLKHPDAILLFRVGDFYETFGEDAIRASRILGIVLTSRNNGGSDIELAGFPYHSLEVYLPKLVKAGHRVAICEQLEKPSKEKKIVKRDVTEVVTPGVTTMDSILDSQSNNFLACIHAQDSGWAIALLDVSTGEIVVHQGAKNSVNKLVQSFLPKEVIFNKADKSEIERQLSDDTYTYGLDEWHFGYEHNKEFLLSHFKVHSLKGYGLEDQKLAQVAAGTALQYVSSMQGGEISHIKQIRRIDSSAHMWMDKFTISSLELIESLHSSGVSLLDTINHTRSPMGNRLLPKLIVLPLQDIKAISSRQEIVSYFIEHEEERIQFQELFNGLGDIERLASKVSMSRINPRELLILIQSLDKFNSSIGNLDIRESKDLVKLLERLDPTPQLIKMVKETIDEDAPYSIKKGNVIRSGYDQSLDEWKSVAENSKELLLDIQATESQRTGIANLKIGFNNVFGYYLEVTNRYKDADLIPDSWVRKQTLKNAERYITSDLKELETKILQANERIEELEVQLFETLVAQCQVYIPQVLTNAQVIAELDCFLSFAETAQLNGYCRPEVDDSLVIDIKDGRHPVIERQLPPDAPYVPNDVLLDPEAQQIIMITGPNMSGKSAVLRQTALIALMAHIGSYVPAERARIGLVDKLFTRVGASDNISSGESTFMLEMNETASILNNLSQRSLILLDEIGRGTSTYDGISIAWSIGEHLHELSHHPKTLFATHYHELNLLADKFSRVKNYHISSKEVGDNIIFIRKLIPGASESSFGIHVARLAGMPTGIIDRAKELLSHLSSKSIGTEERDISVKLDKGKESMVTQLDIFQPQNKELEELVEFLETIDINALTPIECMMKLKELKDQFLDK